MKTKRQVVITTLAQLKAELSAAKAGGQFCGLEGETIVRCNKYPNGTSAAERKFAEPIDETLAITKSWSVEYHFAQDYERTMAKALGVENYNASDDNRKHLLPAVLMEYISTGNVCAICMPSDYHKKGYKVNGVAATPEQVEYIKRYERKRSESAVPYITVGVKNITRLAINGNVFEVHITDTTDQTPALVAATAAAY